jgi:uncharacterized protein YbcC (UPF0753/DUF2309 family)
MKNTFNLQHCIDEAANCVGTTWPLYSFVTSNPLAGFENFEFVQALGQAERLYGSFLYPETSVYRQAWLRGEIEEAEIATLLTDNGFKMNPLESLEIMDNKGIIKRSRNFGVLDRIMSKWLGAFLDEGLAEWEMPNKALGFYSAWRGLAHMDKTLGIKKSNKLPESPEDALSALMKNSSTEECITIFKYHLAALPGWTGYIKQRNETNSVWNQKYPISISDYLAVRLIIARHLNINFAPSHFDEKDSAAHSNLHYFWLKAWERSFQNKLGSQLITEAKSIEISTENEDTPEAQFVLCIDTRSEQMRRHIEKSGPYETFGYAGFFGIAMDYKNQADGVIRKSCPPIVESAYLVSETANDEKLAQVSHFEKNIAIENFKQYFLRRMKNMLPSTFGYVEGSGIFYGLSILEKTFFPSFRYRRKKDSQNDVETLFNPVMNPCTYLGEQPVPETIALEDRAAIVKSAFDLLGWRNFAPLIFFVGHGSHTTNNPFASSLDCGACAANPGRHNARMLAKLANQREVREFLSKNHSLEIPDTTIFVGAEHNTTTDEIEMFDSHVPASHKAALQTVKNNLANAQKNALKERLGLNKNEILNAQTKATSWSETRPEWGLAKNASFIVAPRRLTQNIDLDGRCFLHSYNWRYDSEGKALEGIMQGPMVVTQWINNHYYFSTVANETFGGGSKIIQNITGNFGVVEGNGGDLKMGLPIESLKLTDTEMYHQPLRLSVIIQAPLEWIEKILRNNPNLKNLCDNEWIYLLVLEETEGLQIRRYERGMKWNTITEPAIFNNTENKINLKLASAV